MMGVSDGNREGLREKKGDGFLLMMRREDDKGGQRGRGEDSGGVAVATGLPNLGTQVT